ncbi:bifunctional diguanylate cyclase/phosphodiesterase [Labrenzia sp. VG12]|uniref:putative bifunctional diguanylate cyclase/phosphodiesterase n=1 Tax=Labrenzia sp. VG12 TaxID=2021862 RepID=UPI000B8BEC88|nr:bifunctional diguanylate cyclase/phosphodiesterase [Labrenzia sp. VG12]ASP32494.1 GGDEF-domain containing protein [Labrenzia sp. VG12]
MEQGNERVLAQRLLELAFKADLSAIAVSFTAGIGTCGYLWLQGGDQGFLLYWVIALFALSALRIIAHLRNGENGSTSALNLELASRWRWQNVTGLQCAGIMWAVLSMHTIATMPMESAFVLVLVVFSMSTGATGTLAPLNWPAKFYFLLMVGPIVAAFLARPMPEVTLAVVGLLFFLLNVVFHKANHQTLLKSEQLRLANGKLASALSREQAELKSLNEGLERRVKERTEDLLFLAEHDLLTGILNRTGASNYLATLAEHGGSNKKTVVLFIDLDRFKEMNDGLGHAVGDEVLRTVAARLRENSPSGAAVCRWGGDEFLILYPVDGSNALEEGRALADTLRGAVEAPIRAMSHELRVGFSAGVSISAMDQSSLYEAIRSADLALGEVKRQRRGATRVFSDDLGKRFERQLLISQSLRSALSKEELKVAYQPVVSAETHQLVAYEALLRWKSPFLGDVRPDEFIPIAEDLGEIIPIGKYVLDRGLEELAASEFGKTGVKLAINVSATQLVDNRWPQIVESTLTKHGISAEQLILEVTETAFDAADDNLVQSVLRACRQLGVEVHIDDFGTGYSSLERLHQYPVTALKIDRSFVQQMSSGGLAIIEGSLVIAKKSGLKTVAEGVETLEQARALAKLGVDHLQGYYFGKPEFHFNRPFKGPLSDANAG